MKNSLLRILMTFMMIGIVFGQQDTPKNPLLKSIILPGWGEYTYGSGSAYIFLGTELAIWAGIAGLRYSATVQNHDLISFTTLHAGMNSYPADNAQYWADLGNYDSYLDHRETMLEIRRPDDIWSPEYAWEWDSESTAQTYRDLYRKKELTILSSEFMLTGLIVNRIASAINVKYLQNKNMQLSATGGMTRDGGFLQIGLAF